MYLYINILLRYKDTGEPYGLQISKQFYEFLHVLGEQVVL